ncbi:protein tyrosine phosphatase [Sinimarinibacterium sp. CAU 1509]|uniref:fused DSP-PTPase phosphatase/NAD kinase-like protein n=1 Tax=Sinimarinibacterium sp. CAU 1509 TaxID=2562283 RepID=UPI0010AC15EB|nr:sulfur transferase domain-containing protein [Sinimarinibacterium sp. CAU 1509]TJY64680.1 protein tyrosine phosphatase [Sinimarinibacterium sp. CAU 1509]
MTTLLNALTPELGLWRTAWLNRLARLSAYLSMLLTDHGVVRLLYDNRGVLAPGVERSNQPAPWQIRQAAARGIRTVINLRGENRFGSYTLERAACARHNIRLVNFTIRSRRMPTREEIHGAARLFATIDQPFLMHCKAGADRAGLMSALYVLLAQQGPVEQAMQQLSLRYGHIRQAKTGILDYFFEAYRRDNARTPMPFLTWVDHHYDGTALTRQFRAKWWASWITDRLLRRE